MIPWPGGIFDLVLTQFKKADQVAFQHILEYMSHLNPDSALADQVAQALYEIVSSEYELAISSDAFKQLVHSQTNSIYQDLVRSDKALPRTSFTLPDTRAMAYLDKSDLVYLGKLIKSEQLRARIVDWIKQKYLQNGAPIGNSPKEINAFLREFGKELGLARWKAREIIDTTVSRARVFGQVNGFRAAGAQTFEVAGPDDNRTCPFCSEMLGRTFSVALEIQRQDDFINAGPDAANSVRPFLKGNLALSDLSEMDDSEVQDLGFAAPPYHPSCRHRLVAVAFYENLDEVPYSMG